MADAAIEKKIEAVLADIRPMIQGHGGNIELVKIENNSVYIKLQGACIGCPASFFTLKMGVEEAIKEQVPEIVEVIAVDED
jgi:Fe-S cluster biogenesis protein NfuA